MRQRQQRVVSSAFQETLHTISETCAALNVGPTKAWSLIKEGRLEVVRLGTRCTRVKKSSIERLLQGAI